MLKSPNKRVVWILLISVATILYTMSLGNEAKERVWTIMTRMDTIWFIIMYALSSSHRMCRAMFYNCDKDMMHHSYYTKKSALISNYFVRLGKFIMIDMRVAWIICASIGVITLVTGHVEDIIKVVPVMMVVLLFSIMATIYHVAMYHVFQPYNEFMKVKNPVFKIANVLVAVIGIFFWELPLNAAGVIVIQLISVVGLMAVSYILVKEFGPGNFRVK